MQAGERANAHAGGAWGASLNHYDTGDGCMVTPQQVDEWVYVVGQDDFPVARFSLAGWLVEEDHGDPPFIETDDPERHGNCSGS